MAYLCCVLDRKTRKLGTLELVQNRTIEKYCNYRGPIFGVFKFSRKFREFSYWISYSKFSISSWKLWWNVYKMASPAIVAFKNVNCNSCIKSNRFQPFYAHSTIFWVAEWRKKRFKFSIPSQGYPIFDGSKCPIFHFLLGICHIGISYPEFSITGFESRWKVGNIAFKFSNCRSSWIASN
jgi:hypothetical protein